jgi:hypothetical protein
MHAVDYSNSGKIQKFKLLLNMFVVCYLFKFIFILSLVHVLLSCQVRCDLICYDQIHLITCTAYSNTHKAST